MALHLVETRVEVDERGLFESGLIEVLLMNANPASFRPTDRMDANFPKGMEKDDQEASEGASSEEGRGT
jgi:hypothetical protein